MLSMNSSTAATTAWHEDDRFWEVVEYMLLDPKRPVETEAAQVAKLLELTPGSRILDLCCGPGRYSVEFAKLGYRVTGVDVTSRYLDKASQLAAQQCVEVDYVKCDMREFVRPEAFDTAVNLFTSFGYFSQEDDLRVLRNLHDSLRPGGRLLMEMAGKEVLARIYTPRDWAEFDDGALLLFDREVLPGWNDVRNRWIFVRDGKRIEFNFTHRVYSADELSCALRDSGFEVEGIYGGLDGSAYDRSATRLVVVARRLT